MRSLITRQCLCGLFLLFIAIASPRKLLDDSSISYNDITIKPVTVPVEHMQNLHWDHQCKKLYFVQPMAEKICCFDPATEEVTCVDTATGGLGPTVPVKHEPNKFVSTASTNFIMVSWDSRKNSSNSNIEILGSVDKDKNGTHFEDGKCDSRGRFWAGTMGQPDLNSPIETALNQGSLYRLTCGPVITTEISPVNISNGMAWSRDDKTFYYIDTGSNIVAAYDYDADKGTICNKRMAFNMTDHYRIGGHADGMTIDRDDHLWIAMFSGGRLLKVDPKKGKVIQTVQMPANKPISLTWGGDNLDILYVGTSQYGATTAELEEYPYSGSIFAITGLGAQGLPANKFSWDC